MTPCSHLGGLPMFQRDLLPPFSWQKSGCPQTPTDTYVTAYPKELQPTAPPGPITIFLSSLQFSLCTTTYPVQGRLKDTKSDHVRLDKRKKPSYSNEEQGTERARCAILTGCEVVTSVSEQPTVSGNNVVTFSVLMTATKVQR
jgi:hypothetical protein